MNKNNANEITVRYEIIGHNYRLSVKEKTFKSEKAMRFFFAKLEEEGKLNKILAYAC